jgi:hypothetical protein
MPIIIYMNKIQTYAKKVNIEKQIQLRNALALYGVSAGTSYTIWQKGATTQMKYAVVYALEKVLLVSPVLFLNDPETLLPKKG